MQLIRKHCWYRNVIAANREPILVDDTRFGNYDHIDSYRSTNILDNELDPFIIFVAMQS